MTDECFIRSFGNIENRKDLIPLILLTMVVPIVLTLKLMLIFNPKVVLIYSGWQSYSNTYRGKLLCIHDVYKISLTSLSLYWSKLKLIRDSLVTDIEVNFI